MGKHKKIYGLNKKYLVYQSRSDRPLAQPPPPPIGAVIPADSLYAHSQDHPHKSTKSVQLWIYKTRGSGEWQGTFKGFTKLFGGAMYQIQWVEEKGPSWVKLR